jgi:hypothetical protein
MAKKKVSKEEKTVIRKAPREVKVNEAKLVKAAPALLLALMDATSLLREIHTAHDAGDDFGDFGLYDTRVLDTAEATLRSVTNKDKELITWLLAADHY